MARVLGDTLPDDLHELLDGRDLRARMGQAILITSMDNRGWPHPALVSFGEVVAVDHRHLRLALHRRSGTSRNLRSNGKLTLCLLGPEMAYYIKTAAQSQQDPMHGYPDCARFEATVETVLVDQSREDLEPGARLTAGIMFHPGCPEEEALRHWLAVVDGLRREA